MTNCSLKIGNCMVTRGSSSKRDFGSRAGLLAVAVVHPDELVAVESIGGQNDEDNEVRDQQHHVEAVGLVEPLKRGIRLLLQKLDDRIRAHLRDHENMPPR